MSAPTYTVRSTEVALDLADAPRTEVTTSGLRKRLIEPQRIDITWHSGGVRVVLTGCSVREDGSLSVVLTKGKVSLTDSTYVRAPGWVCDLVTEVHGVIAGDDQ